MTAPSPVAQEQAQTLLRGIRKHVATLRFLREQIGHLGASGVDRRSEDLDVGVFRVVDDIFGKSLDLMSIAVCPICGRPTHEAHDESCWVGQSNGYFAHQIETLESLAAEIELWLNGGDKKPNLLDTMTMLTDWTIQRLEKKP